MSKVKNLNQLEELAKKIAINNVNISIEAPLGHEVFEEIFRNKEIADNPKNLLPQRFIVVIGAGASYSACKGIPLGKEAANILSSKFDTYKDLIDTELHRLEKVYKLKRDEFETKLLALSKFHPKKLVDEIYKLYNHKYYPSTL